MVTFSCNVLFNFFNLNVLTLCDVQKNLGLLVAHQKWHFFMVKRNNIITFQHVSQSTASNIISPANCSCKFWPKFTGFLCFQYVCIACYILLIKTVQVKSLFWEQKVSPESILQTASDRTLSPRRGHISTREQTGEAREKLQLDEMLWWLEEGQIRGFGCMCGLWTAGEGGPCLTSTATTKIIPPIIQDVSP